MSKHRLIDNTVTNEPGKGIIGRCTCGWTTGFCFSSMVASSLFQDHQEKAEKGEED